MLLGDFCYLWNKGVASSSTYNVVKILKYYKLLEKLLILGGFRTLEYGVWWKQARKFKVWPSWDPDLLFTSLPNMTQRGFLCFVSELNVLCHTGPSPKQKGWCTTGKHCGSLKALILKENSYSVTFSPTVNTISKRLVQMLWKSVWRFPKNLEIEFPYNPTVVLLSINSKGSVSNYRNTCSFMFIDVLIIIARKWKRHTFLSTIMKM